MAVVVDKTLLNKAVQLLAQRDHSCYELANKLSLFLVSKTQYQQDADASKQIPAVIEYCLTHNWLDDTQYIEKYSEMRSRKGYGKYKITAELKQRGLQSDMIQSILSQSDIEWADIALQQLIKKFKQINTKDMAQKQKMLQFLLYRGFAQDEIKLAYKALVSTTTCC